MSIIIKPFTFGANDLSESAKHNADHDTIYGEFNGNIDNSNIKSGANILGSKLADASITAAKLIDTAISDAKLDYTSVKIIRANIVGIKMARGAKVMPAMVAGNITVTVTLAADADDGDPQFASANYRVQVTPVRTSGADTYTAFVTAKTPTTFVINLHSTNAGDVSVQTVEWIAIGI